MLPFGSLGKDAVHVAVDMQRLFAEPGPWQVSGLAGIAPQVARLAAARPERTLFTRFLTPRQPTEMHGRWQAYYRHWQAVTRDRLPPGSLDLVPELAALARPGNVVDKYVHGAFEAPHFARRLEELGAGTLVLTGVETDVCVLATLLTAVDRGHRVVAVSDALASSSPEGHDAALRHVFTRFDQQVEIAPLDAVLAAWEA